MPEVDFKEEKHKKIRRMTKISLLSLKSFVYDKKTVVFFFLTQPIRAPKEHDRKLTHIAARNCRASPLTAMSVLKYLRRKEFV
jgi:hypothetical protein